MDKEKNKRSTKTGTVCTKPTPCGVFTTNGVCASNYNEDRNKMTLCCGQEGTGNTKCSAMCPEEKPTCVGFKQGKKMGKCEAPPPPPTPNPLLPIVGEEHTEPVFDEGTYTQNKQNQMTEYVKDFQVIFKRYSDNFVKYTKSVQDQASNNTLAEEETVYDKNTQALTEQLTEDKKALMDKFNQIKTLARDIRTRLVQKNNKYQTLKDNILNITNQITQKTQKEKSLQDVLYSKQKMLDQTNELKGKKTVSLWFYFVLNVLVGLCILGVLFRRSNE